MSTPPPPPGQNPPPYQPQGFPGQQQPYGQPHSFGQQAPYGQQPPGYQPYGNQQPVPQKTDGFAITSLVLSLVGVIPCFWLFPITSLLGVIFGLLGRGRIKRTGAKGMGLAVAGLVIGLVLIALAVAFWVYVATSDNCVRDGSSFTCNTNR